MTINWKINKLLILPIFDGKDKVIFSLLKNKCMYIC